MLWKDTGLHRERHIAAHRGDGDDSDDEGFGQYSFHGIPAIGFNCSQYDHATARGMCDRLHKEQSAQSAQSLRTHALTALGACTGPSTVCNFTSPPAWAAPRSALIVSGGVPPTTCATQVALLRPFCLAMYMA